MSYGIQQHLKPGGDPRMLPDYVSLCDELSKLTHPAYPDVNWPQVEARCLSLFSQNGAELQTAAWYTLARTQRAGLAGLCEGLAVLDTLLSHQWDELWPPSVHARMDILAGLSQQLQQVVRTLVFGYCDLGKLYQAGQHLSQLGEILQRLALKHINQLDVLRGQLHNATIRLESGGNTRKTKTHEGIVLPGTPLNSKTTAAGSASAPEVRVAQPEPSPDVATVNPRSPRISPRNAFVAGALAMLIAGGAALWGWQSFFRTDPRVVQLNASVAPLPVPLAATQLWALQQKLTLPDDMISRTQQQLTRLNRLPPDYALHQSHLLVQQLQILWPGRPEVIALTHQWQQQLNAAAQSVDNLDGWHQGMMQLQQLADRLTWLDEQHGKYMTVSELKSRVSGITQAFNQTIPAEEQLRLLALTPAGQPRFSAQQDLTEQYLKQLLARYAQTTMQPAYDTFSPY